MAQSWPSGVSQWALAGTISEQIEDNRAEFSPEVGPPLRRRRSSIASVLLSFEKVLTKAEYATFESWYNDTLKDGVLTFNMVHPRTQATNEFEFITAPSYSEQTLGAIRVAMQLRKLP